VPDRDASAQAYTRPVNAAADPSRTILRRAVVADVPQMAAIINDAAELGLMLHKSHAKLYENLREFHVIEHRGAGAASGPVVAVGGLSIIWANLAEVVALAVHPDFRGHGLGRRLVEAAVEEARTLGVRKVMGLTYEQAFFERLGFAVVDRKNLPLKVWADCVHCPKNAACDEIAMVRVLEGVPDAAPAAPAAGGISLPVLAEERDP